MKFGHDPRDCDVRDCVVETTYLKNLYEILPKTSTT